MSNIMPLPNLPTISAEEIHANNLRAFRIGNQARYALNQGLRALCGNGLLAALEYSSITEYAEKNFGFKRSQTLQSIQVANALDSLPLSTLRFQAGAIHWSAIREITRIAKPETEQYFPPSVPPRGRGGLSSRRTRPQDRSRMKSRMLFAPAGTFRVRAVRAFPSSRSS